MEIFSHAAEAVSELRDAGFRLWAVEQVDKSLSLQKFPTDKEEKLAIVFGNEVEGVSDEVLKLCDGFIEIPQLGMKHSLNISVAAGIVLWELVREKLPIANRQWAIGNRQ